MRRRRGLFTVLCFLVCLALSQPALAAVDDYPYKSAPCVYPPYSSTGYCYNYDWGLQAGSTAPSNLNSVWGYGFRNCTDWVAWRLNQTGVEAWKWRGMGNARDWPAVARSRGFPTSSAPSPGSVAIIPQNHVAFVEQTFADGSLQLSEYNALGTGTFRSWQGWPAQRGITGYIQFRPGSSPGTAGYSDGSFWQAEDYTIWQIVGGAPLYVSSWARVGGPKPYGRSSRASLAALPKYPRDGTLIASSPSGRVYTIVNGTTFYVSNWANIGGPKPVTFVDDWAVDNQMRQQAPDGTLFAGSQTGRVFQVVGGAPLYISTWSVVGSPQHVITVDEWSIVQHFHLRPYPQDGTYVHGHRTGKIYIVAGGKPFYLTDWRLVGGPRPYQTVDDWVLDTNYNKGYADFPVSGTYLQGLPSHRIWQSNGSRIGYIPNWSQVGGPKPYTSVDDWAINLLVGR